MAKSINDATKYTKRQKRNTNEWKFYVFENIRSGDWGHGPVKAILII